MSINKATAKMMLLVAVLVVAVGTSTLGTMTTTVSAAGTPRQNPGQPPDADCWSEVVSTLTQAEDGQPGIGEHSSDPVPSVPGRETPRAGVGNHAEDTPSQHGATVSAIDRNPDTFCQPD